MRDLTTSRIGALTKITGQVVRTHPVHPELVSGVFVCLDCRTVIKDVEQQFKFTQVNDLLQCFTYYRFIVIFDQHLQLFSCDPGLASFPFVFFLCLLWKGILGISGTGFFKVEYPSGLQANSVKILMEIRILTLARKKRPLASLSFRSTVGILTERASLRLCWSSNAVTLSNICDV